MATLANHALCVTHGRIPTIECGCCSEIAKAIAGKLPTLRTKAARSTAAEYLLVYAASEPHLAARGPYQAGAIRRLRNAAVDYARYGRVAL